MTCDLSRSIFTNEPRRSMFYAISMTIPHLTATEQAHIERLERMEGRLSHGMKELA